VNAGGAYKLPLPPPVDVIVEKGEGPDIEESVPAEGSVFPPAPTEIVYELPIDPIDCPVPVLNPPAPPPPPPLLYPYPPPPPPATTI
jgi:hypothetical protein